MAKFDAKTKRQLLEAAETLAGALKTAGLLTPEKLALETEDKWLGVALGKPTLKSRPLPKILVYAGYPDSGPLRLWVGVGSPNRNALARSFGKVVELNGEIAMLKYSSKTNRLEPQSSLTLKTSKGFAYESGGGDWYYCGRYDLRSKTPDYDWLVRDGLKFVTEIVGGDEQRQFGKITAEAVRQVRLNQGPYRKQLDVIWKDQCAVTGCNVREALRASHIVEFSACTPEQAFDKWNGLLLRADLDALFDKHLISFDGRQQIALSHKLTTGAVIGLGPLEDLRVRGTLNVKQMKYLSSHFKKFQKLERDRVKI